MYGSEAVWAGVGATAAETGAFNRPSFCRERAIPAKRSQWAASFKPLAYNAHKAA
jgi:hypothetical protein